MRYRAQVVDTTLIVRAIQIALRGRRPPTISARVFDGAGDRDRTGMASLEG
jgi:hypothetical protein